MPNSNVSAPKSDDQVVNPDPRPRAGRTNHSAPSPTNVSYLIGFDDNPCTALLAAAAQDFLIRINNVCAITGLSVPTIYRLMGKNTFPRPVKITSAARAWKLSEIAAWVDSRERGATA
jgi:prophage regulatory protein